MLQIVPDQSVELQGNSPKRSVYWNGDTDFYESGLVVDRDNNNYEDNFMTLFHYSVSATDHRQLCV